MFTPWGIPKQIFRIERGITLVIAARGSGLMLSRGYAESRLSVLARNKAIRFGEYYTYTLDHVWAVPMWELPHLWASLVQTGKVEMQHDPKSHLLAILTLHHLDYLPGYNDLSLTRVNAT